MTELPFVYGSSVEMENRAVTSNQATLPLVGPSLVIRLAEVYDHVLFNSKYLSCGCWQSIVK